MFEVEQKAVLIEEKYQQLVEYLQKNATDLGENNTAITFYLTPDFQLKVSSNTSKQTAKMVYKSGAMGKNSTVEEIEIPISIEDFSMAEQFIERIVPEVKKFPTKQLRHDFEIDNINVSLKYSDDWGYHLEFDRNVELEEDSDEIEKEFEILAKKLGVELLSKQQETDFVAQKIAEKKS